MLLVLELFSLVLLLLLLLLVLILLVVVVLLIRVELVRLLLLSFICELVVSVDDAVAVVVDGADSRLVVG